MAAMAAAPAIGEPPRNRRAFHAHNYEMPPGICISCKLDMEIARCLAKRSSVRSRRDRPPPPPMRALCADVRRRSLARVQTRVLRFLSALVKFIFASPLRIPTHPTAQAAARVPRHLSLNLNPRAEYAICAASWHASLRAARR